MRWVVLGLAIANIAIGGYLIATKRSDNVPTDVRAREVNPDRVRIVGMEAAAPAASPSLAAVPGACLEWGTFGQAELDRAQADLSKLAPLRTVVHDLGVAPAWWVYVPPLRTREEAERRVREIADAGAGDARIVTEGEHWRNAISLGIFKSAEAAAAQLARMKAAQVRNVALIERGDLLRLASILVVEPPASAVAQLARLRAAYAGTDLKAVACPANGASAAAS